VGHEWRSTPILIIVPLVQATAASAKASDQVMSENEKAAVVNSALALAGFKSPVRVAC
jgi:hypothetical protein